LTAVGIPPTACARSVGVADRREPCGRRCTSRHTSERWRSQPFRLFWPVAPVALLQRIETFEPHDTADLRLLACFRKRERMKRAKPHIPHPAAGAIPENPALEFAGADFQVEPKPVGIHHRLEILFDLECSQHLYARHSESSASCPSPYGGLWLSRRAGCCGCGRAIFARRTAGPTDVGTFRAMFYVWPSEDNASWQISSPGLVAQRS